MRSSARGGSRTVARAIHCQYPKYPVYFAAMASDTKGQLLHIRFYDELLKGLDDLRFSQRFESGTEAGRGLVAAALEKKWAPKVPSKKD